LRHDCHFGALEKDVRGRRSAGLTERPDVPVNFQGSVEHDQLKMGARLRVRFHFRLHEHRQIGMQHTDDVDQQIVALASIVGQLPSG
jgi:hypothetical protein